MKQLINILKYILFFGIGVSLLWYTFRGQSITDIYEKISHAKMGWIALSLVISFAALISRSLRWNLLIEPLGYKPALSSSFYSLMIGYFANLAIPRIGEITRCGALSKAEKVPFNKLVGTVIVERFLDLIMLAFSILILGLMEYRLIGFLFKGIFEKLSNSKLILSIGAIGFLIAVYLFRRWLRSSSSGKLKERINKVLVEVIEGLKSVFRMKNGYAFVFHTFFIWFMYYLMMYVSFFALESTSLLGAKAGLFVMVAGGLGMSAPVQGGIGTYHFLVSQGLMVYNVSQSDGITFATMVHTWQLIMLIVLGTISIIALFLKNRKTQTI